MPVPLLRALLLLVLLPCAACTGRPYYPGGEIACSEQTRIRVEEAVDGDTVDIEYLDGSRQGSSDRVRLIGIDTPEVDHDGEDHDCYGLLAWQATIDLVVGEAAWMTFDEECSDDYGRTLGYIWRDSDGLFVNRRLVEDGFARACPYSPNTTFSEHLADAEQAAREAELGRWSACDGGGPECFGGGSSER